MLCPKCRNNVTGKWCIFCGAKLSDATPGSNNNNTPPQYHQNNMTGENNVNNTEDMYRDDIYADGRNVPEEGYYNPEDAIDPYDDYYDRTASGSKSKLIAIISICIAILLIGAIVLVKFVFTKDDSKKSGNTSNKAGIVQSDSDNKVKNLTKKGQNLMAQENYKEAESVYSELSELTNDREANIIYEILYNYNRAVKMLNDGNYENAEKFYDKIPPEYVDYDITRDVENLKDNIQTAKKSSQQLEKIREYIDNEDLVSARELMDTINDTYLSPSEKNELQNLADMLDELEKQKIEEQKAEEERKKAEEEARKKAEEEELRRKKEEEMANMPSGYGHLSDADAQSIIYNYAYQLTRAINSNDFNLVAPYIYSSSPLYTQQINLINSCVSQGITEQFNGVTLNSLTKINDTKWEAKVTESETVYYADGSQKPKTFQWTYTIEYISGQFYLTGLR